MKNKKMLKVLSTSFILGTILMTNPTGAEKAEGVSLNEVSAENTQNGQNGKEITVSHKLNDSKETITTNSTDNEDIIVDDSTNSKENGNVEKDLDKDSKKVTEIEKEESIDNVSTGKLKIEEESIPEINEDSGKKMKNLEFRKIL